MVKITLDNISHSYDGKTYAVEDINITFEDGTSNALLGPSGCGKTTLLKIITGLLKPTKGRVYFDDKDVTDLPPEKRNIAIVFQFPVVYSMSVLDNIMFPLMNLKIPKEEKRRRALEIAKLLGLEDILHVHAPRLGPADRQKVALARALVRHPNAFLFDEPVSSIDPDKRAAIKTLIKSVYEKLRQTTIYVTHDQTEAFTFAEKIAIMEKGRIVQYDTLENIFEKPKTEFVAFFVGFPGMNILSGEVRDGELDFKDFVIKLPETVKLPPNVRKIKLGIRPEHVEISLEERKGWLPFKVDGYEDLGRGFGILYLSSGQQLLKARTHVYAPIGSTVWANFPANRLHFFDQEGKRIEISL